MNQTSGNLKEYTVWDGSVRWFHWINVLAILGLIAVGTVILNGKAIGVERVRVRYCSKPYMCILVMCSA